MAEWVVDKTKYCPGCPISPIIGRHFYHARKNEELKEEEPKKRGRKKAIDE